MKVSPASTRFRRAVRTDYVTLGKRDAHPATPESNGLHKAIRNRSRGCDLNLRKRKLELLWRDRQISDNPEELVFSAFSAAFPRRVSGSADHSEADRAGAAGE